MAAAGWTCAVAVAVAIVVLMPLKRVEPFVVRVDNTTGIVDVVPVYDGRATPQEAVTRYFLTHYLTVCERFNFATAETDYEECGAFHSPQRNQTWYRVVDRDQSLVAPEHSQGRQHRAGAGQVGEFFHARERAFGSRAGSLFEGRLRQGNGSEETFSHWVATIQYAYADPAKDPKTRRWNPLGFKIIDFKSEPEVLAEQPAEKDSLAMIHRMQTCTASRICCVDELRIAELAVSVAAACRNCSGHGAPVDGRIRAAPYDSEQVYRLRGFVGYQIDLEFEAGRDIRRSGCGGYRGAVLFRRRKIICS